MPNRIKILDEIVANKIAAGEVIERPASVVKELVENSLDAAATKVVIEVETAGKKLIRVVDDGIGMSRDDALLAFSRHATSKISDEKDLVSITTLGFRGEAVPSIASVSQVEVETRQEDDVVGTKITIDGGSIKDVKDFARASGTTISVRDLFYNTPARRKFLKTDHTELRHIIQAVTNLALANIDRTFVLKHNSREIFSLPKAESLDQRIIILFSPAMMKSLLPIYFQKEGVTIGGLIGKPDLVKSSGAQQYLFINQRPFTNRVIYHAISAGYRTTVPKDTHPDYFIFLKVDRRKVDVNVHPTKKEVRFSDERTIHDVVEEAIHKALGTPDVAPEFDARQLRRTEKVPAAGTIRSKWDRGHPITEGVSRAIQAYAPAAPQKEESRAEDQRSLFMTFKPNRLEALERDGQTTAEVRTIEREGVDESEKFMPTMFQLHNTFILVENKNGLLIIDQHSAHERIMYEQLRRSFDEGGPQSQKLLFPITIHFSPAEYGVVEEFQSLFGKLGFEVEPFGGKSVIIHSVPVLHKRFNAQSAFGEMISELADSHEPEMNQHDRLAKSLACKGSIKAGQQLTLEEMNSLFDQLFATELPYHDVHGRPTIVQISMKDLESRFKRG